MTCGSGYVWPINASFSCPQNFAMYGSSFGDIPWFENERVSTLNHIFPSKEKRPENMYEAVISAFKPEYGEVVRHGKFDCEIDKPVLGWCFVRAVCTKCKRTFVQLRPEDKPFDRINNDERAHDRLCNIPMSDDLTK